MLAKLLQVSLVGLWNSRVAVMGMQSGMPIGSLADTIWDFPYLVPIHPDKPHGVKGLKLQDWCRFLLHRNCWHMLCGLLRPDRSREKAIWSDFWAKFEKAQPEHEVFSLARAGKIQLSNAAAIVYHGDEGRGRKKQPFLVTSFKSCLGSGLAPGLKASKAKGASQHYLKQKCNYVGSVYTTHMLSCVLPKHLYRKDDESVQDIFEFGANCADDVGRHGVVDPTSGERFWMICIAVTGDWQFLVKCGRLARSYYNCEKGRGQSGRQEQPKGICHLCRAGQRDYPFEQLGTRTPLWLPTMYAESGFKSGASFHTPDVLETETGGNVSVRHLAWFYARCWQNFCCQHTGTDIRPVSWAIQRCSFWSLIV